jgi:hypothetical protein
MSRFGNEISRLIEMIYFWCIHFMHDILMSRDSSGGIATGYGLDDQVGWEFKYR